MTKSSTVILIALVLITIQSLLPRIGVVEWAMPQGLISCVVFLAFFECSVGGVIGSFALGLLLDLTSATLLGPWAGAFICVFVLVSLLSQRLFVESIVVAMVVTAVCTLLAGSVYLLLAFEYQSLSTKDLWVLGGQSIASALLTPLVFKVLERAWNRKSVASLGRNTHSVISAV